MRFGPFLGLAILLAILWLGSWIFFHIAGALIHLLLIFVAISLVVHLFAGARATRCWLGKLEKRESANDHVFGEGTKKGESEMRNATKAATRWGLLGASMLFSVSLMAAPVPQSGQQETAPDNTKMNKGDADRDATTADQQKMNPADRDTTKQIRAAIVKDKSLSTYAHNIKIITQDGKVTLKGPVRSEDERSNVEAKAAAVAGAGNVTNQLTIAPPKQ